MLYPLSAQQNLENWEISMQDSVTLEPFDNPVVLNCGHSFSESTIKNLVSIVRGQQASRGSGACPTCRRPIVSYVPNYSLRQVQEGSKPVLPLVAQHIAEGPLPSLPFPGDPTEFLSFSRWKVWENDENVLLIRKMELICSDITAFIDRVKIYGDSNDCVSVEIDCSSSRKEDFKNYFSRLGLSNVDYVKKSCLAIQTRELDWVFSFLMENNTFSKECNVTLITRLLKEKKWRHIELEMKKPAVAPASVPVALQSAALAPPPYAAVTSSSVPVPSQATLRPTTLAPPKPASRSASPSPSPVAARSVSALSKELEGKFHGFRPADHDQKAPPRVEGKRSEVRPTERKGTTSLPQHDQSEVYG